MSKDSVGPGGGVVGFSLLDLRLGVRMLVKFPGLTLVGTLVLSIAIATVAGFYAFTEHFVNPSLPVPEGDRVAAIWNVDIRSGNRGPQTLGDMLTWRNELESMEDVGAFMTHERVVFSEDGRALLVRAALVSPSAFRMLRVPPLLGRHLTDDDQRPGGPSVALIAFDLWQSEFAADPSIVGRTIRMGGVAHSIVGVMPSGFAFPVDEQLWTPLRVSSSSLGPGAGPQVAFTIGRLAPGATLEEAASELQHVGSRLSANYPETHQQLRPQINAYARSFMDADDPNLANILRAMRILIVVVLIIAAVNVATLVYARTAARSSEISVRKALGASRKRIVLQLFAEALVLASLAGGVGLGLAMWSLRKVMSLLTLGFEGIPYWWDAGIGSATLLLVVFLVLLSAVLTGILPALAITGRRMESSLQRAGDTDAGLQFGWGWSTIVVAQVAISLGALTLGGILLGPFVETYALDDGVAREEYLAAEIRLDREPWLDGSEAQAAEFARNAEIWRELGRRLSREPGVLGVTFATSLPGVEHPVRSYHLEGVPVRPENIYGDRARVAWTEPGYFRLFGVPLRAGRAFNAGDVTGSEARVAIVNEAFVSTVLGRGEPIGQRIQLNRPDDGASSQWAEIVGVVPDLTVDMGSAAGGWPVIYFPLVSTSGTINLAMHLSEDPSLFTGMLRAIAGGLDASIVVRNPGTLDDIVGAPIRLMHLSVVGLGLLVLAAVVLSTAGVYSLMSFTVSQRTREIGIRTALGAHPRRVVRDVFSRAILQLSVGTALGLAPLLGRGELLFQYGPWSAIAIVSVMLIMGLSACGIPLRRALRIQPTEALRDRG